MRGAVRSALAPLTLFCVAGAYFGLGLSSSLELIDQGQIVYPSWQVAQGAIPYRDFQHAYGPSLFLLNGLLLRVFGVDLLVLRIFLVLIKAGTAYLTYHLTNRVAGRDLALLAFGAFVAVWGTPFWVFQTPYASHYAQALCVAGIALLLWLRPSHFLAAYLAAGLCFGAAATFKQTSGLFAAIAVALFSILSPPPASARRPSPVPRRLLVLGTAAVLGAAVALSVAYLRPRATAWTFAVLAAPLLATVARIAQREWRRGFDEAARWRALLGLFWLAAGMALPLLAYVGFFAAAGGLSQFLSDTGTQLPHLLEWFEPYPTPNAQTLALLTLVLGAFAVLWFARAGRSMAAVAAAIAVLAGTTVLLAPQISRFGISRGLLWAWGGNAVALWFSIPPLVVWVTHVLVFRDDGGTEREWRDSLAALYCYGATSLLYLYPAADYWHVVMALPSFLPLLAHVLERYRRNLRRVSDLPTGWPASVAAAALLLFLALPSVQALAGAWMARSDDARLARATGVVVQDRKTESVAQLIDGSERYRAADEMLVLTGELMIPFLAGRHSPTTGREFTLYLVAIDLIDGDVARHFVDQADLVQRLQGGNVLVVDAPGTLEAARFRRAFPMVGSYIDEHYRVAADYGPYRLLAAPVD